jgi:hypothetical protein
MALGFGSLKGMMHTFRYNRNLLGKKKSARELYKEEIKKRDGNFENQNLEDVRIRVAERLKSNHVQEIFARITALLILFFVVAGIILIVSNTEFTWKRKGKYEDKSTLFKTVIYRQENGVDLKVDYFVHGPKAAETLLKNGMKHQNTESYYESGQQFRSALYYYDSLITDIYFFKTGDTIKTFPLIKDKEVHRIVLLDKKRSKKIEFDFWEGKIVQETYIEIGLSK